MDGMTVDIQGIWGDRLQFHDVSSYERLECDSGEYLELLYTLGSESTTLTILLMPRDVVTEIP